MRTTFGYSFATWRFHLRGESIRSAHDVGWIRNLTVDRMMRPDIRTARAGISMEEFQRDFPIGSTQRVIIVDEGDKYAGIVLVADIYASPVENVEEGRGLADFVRYRNDFLQPQMNAKQAAAIFDKTESEALAVVNNLIERKVIGLLTESHTLAPLQRRARPPPARGFRRDLDVRRRQRLPQQTLEPFAVQHRVQFRRDRRRARHPRLHGNSYCRPAQPKLLKQLRAVGVAGEKPVQVGAHDTAVAARSRRRRGRR